MDSSSNGSAQTTTNGTSNPHANRGTVAVTGATGFVGGHMVRTLVERGWNVRALSRSREKAAALREREGVTVVAGDIGDADALTQLVRGCDAVIHLVGIIREAKGQRFDAMHVE
ncbi:MAG: SDR family NAD(P)-dependent oxidoreductase, partial [Planctomycetota bacterium]